MTSKLHILFLCGWYPSRVLPSNGNFVQRHAESVAKKHLVSALHIITDEHATNNIEIVSKRIRQVETHIAYVRKTRNPFLKFYLFYKSFFLLLKKINSFDIVHLNEIYPFGIFSLYLKWFRKKKFIISEHWTDYKFPLSQKISVIQKLISKIIVKNSAFICPVSKDLEQSMKIFGFKGNYQVVPNVVDTNVFTPNNTPIKKFTIVHISNMVDDHKNISGILNTLAKAQKEMESYEAIFIGTNSDKYRVLADELKLNSVSFLDFLPHHELITYLQRASVFILFSNYENLPCVILESFSCGTPVISTDVGGISEFFPENFGKLIPLKSEDDLKSTLLDFYHKKYDIASKNKMHTYTVENFSPEYICKQFEKLYSLTLK